MKSQTIRILRAALEEIRIETFDLNYKFGHRATVEDMRLSWSRIQDIAAKALRDSESSWARTTTTA